MNPTKNAIQISKKGPESMSSPADICHHEHHRVKVLEAEIAALKAANASLRSELEVSRAEVASLANSVVSKDCRILALEQQERELKHRVDHLCGDLATATDKIKCLSEENEALRKKLLCRDEKIVELAIEVGVWGWGYIYMYSSFSSCSWLDL